MNDLRHIAIVDENQARAAILEDGSRAAGFDRIDHITEIRNLLAQLNTVNPDIILIDLAAPDREGLEQAFNVSRMVKRPIAIFTDHSDPGAVQAAVDAGISAYMVGSLCQESVRHGIALCVSRFSAVSKLQCELDRAKAALEERKVIDRAKGLLMAAKSLTEDQAYALMRKTAMNENKKIADIAQSIVTTSSLLK